MSCLTHQDSNCQKSLFKNWFFFVQKTFFSPARPCPTRSWRGPFPATAHAEFLHAAPNYARQYPCQNSHAGLPGKGPNGVPFFFCEGIFWPARPCPTRSWRGPLPATAHAEFLRAAPNYANSAFFFSSSA